MSATEFYVYYKASRDKFVEFQKISIQWFKSNKIMFDGVVAKASNFIDILFSDENLIVIYSCLNYGD